MDFFFFQLAIIFLPGLLWERIASRYGLKKPPTQFEVALRTFTFGLASYAMTFGIFSALGIPFYIPEVSKDAAFIVDRKYIWEFLVSLAVAFASAIAWLYFYNRKWLGRFLRRIGATKKVGDEDLWDIVFTSSEPWSEYVYVRDYENKKVFSGWVTAFSETEQTRELVLRDVEIFNLEGQFLYSSPLVYLGRSPQAVDIEFPVAGESGSHGKTTSAKSIGKNK